MAKVWYGHFDSQPESPRSLYADDLARFFTGFMTDGVRSFGDNLEVSPGAGMSVNINKGMAHVQGRMFGIFEDVSGASYNLALPSAHPQHPRIDRVILRMSLNLAVNSLLPVILMGSAGDSPVPPPLTRTTECWEISLAQVRIPAGAALIGASAITDERANTELCGQINSALGLDPSVWQRQFDAFMASAAAAFDGSETDRNQALNDALTGFQQTWGAELDERKSAWSDWFAAIRTSLEQYTSFNFDYLMNLPGVSKTTASGGSGTVSEIRLTADDTLVASRTTALGADGSVTQNEILYGDGGAVLRNTAKTASLQPDGSILEAVS